MKNELKTKKSKIGDRFYSKFFGEYIYVEKIISPEEWYFRKESDPETVYRAKTLLTYFENNPKLYDRRVNCPEIRDLQFYEDVNMIEHFKKLLYFFIFLLVLIGIFVFMLTIKNLLTYVK